MDKRQIQISKRLSSALRHRPEKIGIVLDAQGWTDVERLLVKARLDRATLEAVVAGNDKQRFAFNDDGTRIRANQGHSVAVDLALPESVPPAVLYHGTGAPSVAAIRAEGLKPGRRHDVHLSADVETARTVGARHGKPVVLTVDAAAMHAAGHRFFRSENGAWLTASVPPEFLRIAPG